MRLWVIVVSVLALTTVQLVSSASAALQTPPAALADSARRLDSLATAFKVFDRPTSETRERVVQLWTQAAALYQRAGDRRHKETC